MGNSSRPNDDQAVWLSPRTGQLGYQFIGAHPYRTGQSQLMENPLLNILSYTSWGGEKQTEMGHIDKSLIDGGHLNLGRILSQNSHYPKGSGDISV
jgi:hypothetical protein